jgi:hypothetical protein
MLERPTVQDFAPHRNTSFRVVQMDGYELKLAEIIDHSNARLEQFSLVFTCPTLPWLQQGTYALVHPGLDKLNLFLVPIGPMSEGMRYESVFSRFVYDPSATSGD